MQSLVRLQHFLLSKSQMFPLPFVAGSTLRLPQLSMSSARVWRLHEWGCDLLVHPALASLLGCRHDCLRLACPDGETSHRFEVSGRLGREALQV